MVTVEPMRMMEDAAVCPRCGARMWPRCLMAEHREYHRKRDSLFGADNGRKCMNCGTFFRGYYPRCRRCRSAQAMDKKQKRPGAKPGEKKTKHMGGVKEYNENVRWRSQGRKN